MPQNHHKEKKLPTFPEPYWRDFIDLPAFTSLQEDIKADAVIVGGGITGITAAYLLASEGLQVVLLEASKLLNGTTGHTTAKITAQHHLIYDEIISHMGKSKARLYYEANMDALAFIRKTVQDQHIDCDFSDEDAYIYATTDQYARKLEKEYKAYQNLNINGELKDKMPLDLNIKKALVMKDQAQFHPIHYLAHLIQVILDKGGRIYESTVGVNVDNRDQPAVLTSDGHRVTADHILSCSHYPFYDGLHFYFTRMYADRSYIIAAKTDREFPGGMYINAENPPRSLRSAKLNGENLILIGGESHKTGQGKDTLEHYKALESFGQETLGIKDVVYRWSAQDLITLDKVPYIGEMSPGEQNLLVATGYRKWGMTNGTVAALLLRDIVLKRENPYQKLFEPSRFYADPSLKEFFSINGDVAKHLVKGKFQLFHKNAEDLANDEGGVVTYKGERAGAYKDDKGQVHIVDTTCTHLGCETEWNHGDRTWDCPCHGSRFSYTGEVIEGPAEKPLKRMD
ncbi:glycine/D-amino acid oxidase-like deaminating enzyme [Scopulibacillus darangshiensis]|uniref:Glycine/D-amino acid oxidase-like deaminating enzyme n=1 Tax=Scopulibacillus darangshiensis TaxID=442528 RepID=A0A4R2NZJ4_9BACL|nr:FAD-dependent oxidoreductase [Scopulibacillus darangshiensis]TCP27084.1 glycine/D-amino acid oxidase-like deaminating enzyme [Scopulibacillus darangshiensis]